jgi:dTDP-4-dehydrorhamnose reductase
MRLLVTGAAGMLGHEVVAAAERLGHEVAAWDLPECDLTDAEATAEAVRRLDPRAVINCAAYTDVDRTESDEAAAERVNADAAGNLARACAAIGGRLVHVSTDYVFDGVRAHAGGGSGEPWLESDAVNPIGAYGRSKLAGEEQVAAATAEHAIVRTAWLFGAGGRNFVDTMLALGHDRDEVSVVTDQVGSPTWTVHLAEALVELSERSGDVGILHAAGAGACSWYELAVEVFDRAGVRCRVLPTTSDRFPSPARRPAYSVLGTERDEAPVLPPWQTGVAGYLTEKAVVAR